MLVEPGEEKCLAVGRETTLRGLSEWNDFAAPLGVNGDELWFGKSRVAAGAVENAAVGSPAGYDRGGIPGAALGKAAVHGHGVNVNWALVFGGESDGFAVGRNSCAIFHPRVGSEASSRPAFRADRPEIALGGEDDGVAVNRGVAIVTGARRGGFSGIEWQEKEQREESREERKTKRGAFLGVHR